MTAANESQVEREFEEVISQLRAAERGMRRLASDNADWRVRIMLHAQFNAMEEECYDFAGCHLGITGESEYVRRQSK